MEATNQRPTDTMTAEQMPLRANNHANGSPEHASHRLPHIIAPSWLEACLGVPTGRLEAAASNKTLVQCFETLVNLSEIRIQVVGDRQHLPDAHIVIANHQSCLDAVSLYLTLRRHMEWVVPVPGPDLTATNEEYPLHATVSNAVKALSKGNFNAAKGILQAAIFRFPVLLSSLPMIGTPSQSDLSDPDALGTFIDSGTAVINARKAYDEQTLTAPPPPQTRAKPAKKQQLCLFPQSHSDSRPPKPGDYGTNAFALWAKTSSLDSPTKLAPVTIQYPNGTLSAIALRKALSWLTGQRFHNVINLQVDPPLTFEECQRRLNTIAKKNNTTNNNTNNNSVLASQVKDRIPHDKTDNDIGFPPNLPTLPNKRTDTRLSASLLTPIPENGPLGSKNEVSSKAPSPSMINGKGDATLETSGANAEYQPIADHFAQQSRLNLRYLNNLGPNINPKNTANYAKAFCRLVLMGASAAMVDWVQRHKISSLLPTDAFQNNLSRAVLATMTLAMVRYTFSGTMAARH